MLKKQKTSHLVSENLSSKWYLVDATGCNVGRLATKIATVLRGKHRSDYSPHLHMGDHVVVVNCEKVEFTGNKWDAKLYRKHTGFIGGLKERTAKEQLERDPSVILTKAVKGMLPSNRLRNAQLKNLRIFKGSEHTHTAQKPEKLEA